MSYDIEKFKMLADYNQNCVLHFRTIEERVDFFNYLDSQGIYCTLFAREGRRGDPCIAWNGTESAVWGVELFDFNEWQYKRYTIDDMLSDDFNSDAVLDFIEGL